MITNYSPAGIYEAKEFQNRYRFPNGEIYANPVPEQKLPCFSITSSGSLTAAVLIEYDATTELGFDVLSAIETYAGTDLEGNSVNVFGHYATTGSIAATPDPGMYYLKLTIGGVNYYSDVFVYSYNSTELTRITYNHAEDFHVSNNHLIPSSKNMVIYFDYHVSRPSYQFENDVSKLRGKELPRQQTSYKQYKIVGLFPEYIFDALRLVNHFDYIEVRYKGQTLTVDKFLVGQPTWLQGELASAEHEFITDMITVTNGRAV